jgi:hypothetical protein
MHVPAPRSPEAIGMVLTNNYSRAHRRSQVSALT